MYLKRNLCNLCASLYSEWKSERASFYIMIFWYDGLYWMAVCIIHNRLHILRTVLVVYLSIPFLLKSSYTLLRIMLETVWIPPLTSLICEIKTRGLILWKYQVILVIEYVFIIKGINYALWHTFESKRYMYFHNKTWYTCTRYYM